MADDLANLSAAQLRAEWRKAHKGKTMPDGLGRDLATRAIRWRRQERQSGGYAAAVRRELLRLGRELQEKGEITFAKAPPLKPGTKLIRQWHGITYQVLVLDDGFLFQDRTYSSLTQIARDITGAAWSGPRFFGLVGRGNGKS